MVTEVKKRKRRSDRQHLIYSLTNTVTGEQYVGLAVCIDRNGRETLRWRWHRHVQRARDHGKSWRLCESIRAHGAAAFRTAIIEFVRGKAAAHQRELQLKRELQAALNTA